MKSSYFHDISIYMVHIQMNYHAISIVHVKRCKAQTEDAPVCCVRVYVLLLLRSQMDGPVSLVIALSLSLTHPVAMAATQRPSPPCLHMEGDRPIRTGHRTHCDYLSTSRGETDCEKQGW